MANPIHVGVDAATAVKPAGATCDTTFPSVASLDHLHIQVGWDGTPNDADNREDVALRFTVWAPLGQPNAASDAAGVLRARLLDSTSSDAYRFGRGSGRLPGIDPDTGLPFCSFTLNVALHALTP